MIDTHRLDTMLGYQLGCYPDIPAVERTPDATHRWNQYIGIELELEYVRDSYGNTVSTQDDEPTDEDDEEYDGYQEDDVDDIKAPRYWDIKPDASLRNGIEFVLGEPLSGAKLEKAVEAFYEKGYTHVYSPRISTHIHVNMMDATAGTLRSLFMLTYALEEGIYAEVDPSRKWCGFAASLSDYNPSRLRCLLNTNSPAELCRTLGQLSANERYYGLNLSILRHGTAEFRYFKGGPTKEELCNWIDLVVAIKNISSKHSPEELLDKLGEANAARTFLQSNLPPYWATAFTNSQSLERIVDRFHEVSAARTQEPECVTDADRRPALFQTARRKHIVTPAFLDRILMGTPYETYLSEGDTRQEKLNMLVVDCAAGRFQDTLYNIARTLTIEAPGQEEEPDGYVIQDEDAPTVQYILADSEDSSNQWVVQSFVTGSRLNVQTEGVF